MTGGVAAGAADAMTGVVPLRAVRPVRPVFVGGCPRSGTTLLGAMLGVGPTRLTVPEAWFKMRLLAMAAPDGTVDRVAATRLLRTDPRFALWRVALDADPPPGRVDAAALVDQLVLAFGARTGKPAPTTFVDHSPSNVRHARSLAQAFPDARFVHLVRDGRAVMASVLPLDWGPNRATEAAAWWATHVAMGLAAERDLGPQRVRLVRFEDLVSSPNETLADLCGWLGLDFDPAMVATRDYAVADYTVTRHERVARPPDPARVDAWRTTLRPHQVEDFEYVTWELSAHLGYDLVHGAAARLAPRHVRLVEFARDVARRGVVDRVRRRRSARRPYR